jgi:hypothetical protein
MIIIIKYKNGWHYPALALFIYIEMATLPFGPKRGFLGIRETGLVLMENKYINHLIKNTTIRMHNPG